MKDGHWRPEDDHDAAAMTSDDPLIFGFRSAVGEDKIVVMQLMVKHMEMQINIIYSFLFHCSPHISLLSIPEAFD